MAEVERGLRPGNPVSGRVYDVIGDLTSGTVSQRDRSDLRKALDKAEAPKTGRAASDAALGNISRALPKS